MSTTKGECPQPSDAAMAAAERIKLNYLITLDHPDLYPVPTEQLAAVIDRHFAPLREENDKLRAAVEGTYSLAVAWANYYAMQYDCKGGAHPRHRAILDEAKAALAPGKGGRLRNQAHHFDVANAVISANEGNQRPAISAKG